MILDDFALLASDTARTRAYIQMMVKEDLIPSLCIVYTDNSQKMEIEADEFVNKKDSPRFFDNEEPVLYTIRNNNIKHVVVNDKDINSKSLCDAIKGCSSKYLIYSGYGGYILKAPLFQLGKKYVHVHAGILPQYRGSTTAYYSLLQENYIGATAIFLSEGIDEGEIITSERFSRPDRDVNIDIIYEPYLRSMVLKKALNQFVAQKGFSPVAQSNDDAQTYFIIHPVLKHLAMMREG